MPSYENYTFGPVRLRISSTFVALFAHHQFTAVLLMKYSRSCLAVCVGMLAALLFGPSATAESTKEAHVTQVVREVDLLPNKKEVRPAAVNDPVREGEAVRTGDKSRSELTFADLTISRLGANSIFSFNKAGRDVQLNAGSILLRVPKDSGGAGIHTSAVTVAVTGTTVIVETMRAGRNKLIVLEGGARLSLTKYPKQSQFAHAGQMIDVPAGATTVPPPVDIDLNQVLRTHPLITEFRPLPSYPLIVAAANQQGAGETVYQGRPAGPGAVIPPWYPPDPGRTRPNRDGGNDKPPKTDGGKPGRGTGSGAQTTTPPAVTESTPTPAPTILRTTRQPGATIGGPRRTRGKPTPPPIR